MPLNIFLVKSVPLSLLWDPYSIKIQRKIVYQDDDSNAIRAFKKALQEDMNSRYIDPNIKFLMYKSSFLDPRFKTLAHLPTTLQEKISGL